MRLQVGHGTLAEQEEAASDRRATSLQQTLLEFKGQGSTELVKTDARNAAIKDEMEKRMSDVHRKMQSLDKVARQYSDAVQRKKEEAGGLDTKTKADLRELRRLIDVTEAHFRSPFVLDIVCHLPNT